MTLKKLYTGIKLSFFIMRYLEGNGLVKAGKVIVITNNAGRVATSVDNKLTRVVDTQGVSMEGGH